jgi:hypothetical protein
MLAALSPHVIVISFWLLLLVFSAFFLRMACSLCRTEMPSWKRAFVSVVIVTFLSYLAFDFTAYLVMLTLKDQGLYVPPGYGYTQWFREPLGLKLYIISHSSFLHYIPFINALCAAGVLQVIVLQAQVNFHWGTLIFLMQWGATLLAGYIVALVLGVGLDAIGYKPEPPPDAKAAEQAKAQAKGKQATPRKGRQVAKRPRRQTGKKTAQAAPEAKGQTPDAKAAEEKDTLKGLQHNAEQMVASSKEYFEHAWPPIKDYADSYLDDVKEATEPVTKHLPEPAQNFLNNGGWWGIFAFLILIILLWLRSLVRRLSGALSRPRKKKKKPGWKKVTVNLKESLKKIGDAYTEEGPQQITVKGMPARLRLVVLSTGGRNTGLLTPEMVDRVLDWIKPGLAEVCTGDYPRVKVWPPFYSLDGFHTAFVANVRIPEPKGDPTNWVLVTGQVKMGNSIVQVGLALHAEQATNLRHLKVRSDNWLDVLGVIDTEAAVGAR